MKNENEKILYDFFYVWNFRSKDLQNKLESSVFHNAKDKEERFSAYSCRVELLEKSKLIRTQVSAVQYRAEQSSAVQ